MESILVLSGLAVLAVPVLLVLALVGLGNLKQRVAVLEDELARLRAAATPPSPAVQPAQRAPRPEPSRVAATVREPAPVAASTPSRPVRGTASAAAVLREPPAPTAFDRLLAHARRWFTEGNVPVKVGMLVLLAGVAALLKYASDQGWLRLPMGLRLAAIAAAALAALGFAWRRRESHRSFALAVQGGSIGVLLLVVFAAFKLYGLLPAALAFAISVALVGALGVLAVLQDSRTLAVLGILAGFMAPIWLSTGSGNHVVLFSYYALLNAAIFAIAWRRPWRELILLGWAFTWGIGVAWGVLAYSPAKFASTQPFLLLFFAFYLLLPLLYARRRAPGRRDVVDGCLLFGTPLVAFALQAGLLEGDGRQLAACALALAAVYAGLAWWQRRSGSPHAVLVEAHVLLAGGFAILAAPLALSARATAAVFAVEGAGLVWLGLRTARRLPRWTGAGLQLAAALAFLIAAAGPEDATRAVLNPMFAGALLIALAGFASAWWLHGAGRSLVAVLFYGWGLAWWAGAVVRETGIHVPEVHRPDALLAALALTGLLAAQVQRWRQGAALVLTVTGTFALAMLVPFAQLDARGQPLAGWGAVAWLVFAAFGLRSLACLGPGDGTAARWAHVAWWLLWPLLLSVSAWELAHVLQLGGGWRLALGASAWLVLLAVLLYRGSWLRWPLEPAEDSRGVLAGLAIGVAGGAWLVSLGSAGASAPLPWLPLLNPLDVVQLATLALFARWLWSPLAPADAVRARVALLSIAGIALVTCITLRGVHHWGGVGWSAAMWSTSLAQTALTLVWSVLGVAGWIAGSRRGQRTLWLAGAVLMGVVLAKLVLFDRQHLGDLLGIGSFIGYGLLCTLVGWFAPAPPRAAEHDADGEGDRLREPDRPGVAGG